MKLYAIYVDGVKVSTCSEEQLVDELSDLTDNGIFWVTCKRIS